MRSIPSRLTRLLLVLVAESVRRLQQGAGGLHQGQAQQGLGGSSAPMGGLPQRGKP